MVDKRVYRNAEQVLLKLNKLGLVTKRRELDFDLIYPFLLPTSLDNQKKIAFVSRLYREIVDYQNKYKYKSSSKLTKKLLKFDTTLHIKNIIQYNNINKKYRKNIFFSFEKSYLDSTQRVYYRNYIIKKYIKGINADYLKCINIYSAFLLFDDDLFDYNIDKKNKKNTILIQLLKEKKIDDIIKESIVFLNRINGLECKKCKEFKLVLEGYY